MAHSVTPPSHNFLGSSPHSGRSVPSLKRVSSRGSAQTPARAVLSFTAPSDTERLEDSLARYSLSTSPRFSGVKLSGPSPVRSNGFSPAAQVVPVTVGFQLEDCLQPCSGSNQAQLPPKKQGGLLSQAFHMPSDSFLAQGFGSMFPDVDLTPLKQAQALHSVFKNDVVVLAYTIAAQAHCGKSKHGTSVLEHCLETAKRVAGMGLDADSVAATLLHEVARGNSPSMARLEEFMPKSVVQMVTNVSTISEISRLYRQNRDALGEEGVTRMLLAMEDVNAMLIKLADRVHTMQLIVQEGTPTDANTAFLNYALAKETLEIFSVVANRLGVWGMKAELEDLSFAILQPSEYKRLKAMVSDRQDAAALSSTINQIKADLDALRVKYEDISGRPKNLYGIWTKMREGKVHTIDSIFDVIAIRVVVTNKHDCYVVQRAVQQRYRLVPGRSKDFIKDIKKPNGYQSLHETVYGESGKPVEIQIRTHKMHYIAEYGFAAHWKYKEKLDSEDQWLEKEVQYKKWLTTYKLGVHDNKVRPVGAAPTDTALKSLGVKYICDPQTDQSALVDPFLKHTRFKLTQPARQEVSIVLQTDDLVEFRHLQHGTTIAELSSQLGLQGFTLTVNSMQAASSSVLRSCDIVRVLPSRMAMSAPSRGPGLDMYVPGFSAPIAVDKKGRTSQTVQ